MTNSRAYRAGQYARKVADTTTAQSYRAAQAARNVADRASAEAKQAAAKVAQATAQAARDSAYAAGLQAAISAQRAQSEPALGWCILWILLTAIGVTSGLMASVSSHLLFPWMGLLMGDTKDGGGAIGAIDQTPVTVGMTIGGFSVTSGFGPRPQPKAGASTHHMGVDLGMAIGTPLYQIRLVYPRNSVGFGNA